MFLMRLFQCIVWVVFGANVAAMIANLAVGRWGWALLSLGCALVIVGFVVPIAHGEVRREKERRKNAHTD